MEEQQWRSESVALDAPPTVQTTTVPAPKMPVGKQIPWKWVFGAGILVVALVAGLLFLRSNLAKNQEPTNNGQVKTQNVDLGKLAKNTTPLTLDKTDRVVINGQLQTTQGLVINPTAEPTTSVLGQVYLDSTTGDLRYYNGTTYLTIANSDAVGLTEVEVLALLTAFGTKLPQDLATTASPLFGGLKLNGTNGNAVLLQAAAGTANVTLTLPANGGAISQCLTTDGAGTLSFSACASGSGNAFLQGGNAFAATGVLGTTDNNDLNFITNNITRLTVAAGGNVGIGNATPGNKLSINSPTSPDGLAQTVIATGALANKGLVVQGVIFQSGSLLELQEHTGSSVFSVGATGNTSIRTATNSVTAFQVQNSAGSGVLNVDTNTSTGLVGIGIAPAYKLDVNGDINIVGTSALRIGGTIICTASGCDATSGSGSYIQNGNGIQSNANFGIQSANATYIGAKVRGAAGQSASLLELQISNATPVFSVGSTGNVVARPSADSATAFQIQNAAGSSNLLIADTNLNYVGIGIAPAYKLDVNGDINIVGTSALRIGGTIICTASGCDATSGSGSYIQNGNGIQSNANFGIQSANATYVGGVIKGAVSQSADLFQLQNSAGTNLFNVTATGAATFQNTSDTTGAFRVLDAAGTSNVLVVDTLNKRVGINTYPSGYALDVNGDVNLTSAVASLRITGTVVCNLAGCAASSGSGNYIQNGNGVQTNGNFAIQSANIGYVGGLIRGAAGQTADLLQIQNSGTANLFSVGATGSTTFQNSADNSAAFNIKQSGGTTIFWADTLQGTINATNTAGNAFIGTTNNNLSYGVVGTQSFGVGGGVKGVGGGGYGVLGQSETNASGLFQTTNTAGTNTAATLVARANTNQSTNVFEVQNTAGTSVFGVSPAGIINTAVLAKNSTNSTTAFQVQNAAGAQLFNIDTTNSVININGNNSGTLQAWANTTAVGSNFVQHATVSNGSYLYRVAGLIGLSLQSSVNYAPINPDGTVGAWANTTALGGIEAQRQYPGAVIANGYMYVIGGANFANGGAGPGYTQTNSIYYGAINSDGSISSWKLADNKMVTAVGGAGVVAHNGYLYVIGGGTTADYYGSITPTNSVQYAKLNADGSVGSFCVSGSTCTSPLTAPPALTDARMVGQAIVSNGYLYFVGGRDGASTYGVNQKDIYRTLINSDGSLGSWTKLTGVLTTARGYLGVGVLNGYLYAAGGGVSSYEYAKIGASGALGAFTQPSNPLTVTSGALGMATANGYFYIVSGSNLGEVQYASGPRTYVGGSLDLVGLGGNGLQSSSGGGTLTAGNTLIAGRFQVTDAATFMQGVSINGDISGSGQAVFRSTTNSSTAFQIQNSSGASVLYADTENSFVSPGVSSTLTAVGLATSGYTLPGTNAAGPSYGTALAADGKAVFSVHDTSSNSIYIVKCTSFACDTYTTSVQLAAGEASTNNSQTIVTYNGNPMLFYRQPTTFSNAALRYIKCGNASCTSGNTPAASMYTAADPGLYANATIGPDGFPYIAHKLNNSGNLAITRCRTAKPSPTTMPTDPCSTSSTVDVSSTGNVGNYNQMDRGGCFVGDTSSNCVVVAHINTTDDQVQVSVCTGAASSAATTGSWNSCGATINTTIPVTGVVSNPGSLSMFVVNGSPTIFRLLSTGNIEVFRCANVFCTSYTHNATAVIGAANYGMNAIIGKNGNPLITYTKNPILNAMQCGNATCSSGNATNSNLHTLANERYNNAIIAGDGFPLILSSAPGGSSNPDVNITHCIDASCQTEDTSTASGGVSLGSKPSNSGTDGMFMGLFTQSINNGIQNASFSYGMDGTVVANALSSDTSGNVLVSSVSATALKVMNSNTSDTVLSVDSSGTTNSVNIGTSTSVAGYGFNSAAASLFRNTTNSTSAFSVENLSSQSILKVDTSAGIVSVGSSSVNANVLFNNSTNANTLTLQSGATASTIVLTLPTTAGSVGDCLQSNGFGVLSFNACTGGAGGGVTSIAGQIGVVTVNNATGSGGVLTIDDASTSAKGIASFNSTNFSVSSGAVNTIQNINTGATPQFAGVLANSLDTAAAGTLTIGGSTQTAISLGRTGITTTNAGALTVSQLLTAGLANNATLGITGLTVNANADINGIVSIGSGATPNAFYALGIGHDFTATTNPTGCPHVFFFGNVCSGVYATAQSNGLTGLTDAVAGGSFGVNNTGSTVLEAAYGLIVRSATNSSSGSIVSAVGLSVAPQTVGTSLNYGVSISTSSTSALQLGADLATPTTYNSGVSFGYDNDTVLFRTAAGQLAVGTAAGATTLKLSPTAITSTGGLTINTTTSSTLTLDSGTTGAVNIGNSANAKAVTVGSSTGGSSLTLQAGTGTIGIGTSASTRTVNIATGAAAQTVTLGSSTGASSLLLASGTGGITFAGHIISGNSVGSTATAFAVGAAACTGGVATSSAGNDTAGKIVVTTGASGCAAGTIVTVTFGTTYTTAPMVVLTPGDSVTAGENLNYYATPTATTFVLGTQTTTTISKTLTFYYHVIR